MEKLSFCFGPLSIIKRIRLAFFLWVLIMFFMGQLGILSSIWTSNDIERAIFLNFKMGNFYIFGISCVSAGIYIFAEEYGYRDDVKFKKFKLLLSGIAFMFIIYGSNKFSAMPMPLELLTIQIEWSNITSQLAVYIVCIVISIYMFCVSNMEKYYDDYSRFDDNNMTFHKKDPHKITKDSNGVNY